MRNSPLKIVVYTLRFNMVFMLILATIFLAGAVTGAVEAINIIGGVIIFILIAIFSELLARNLRAGKKWALYACYIYFILGLITAWQLYGAASHSINELYLLSGYFLFSSLICIKQLASSKTTTYFLNKNRDEINGRNN